MSKFDLGKLTEKLDLESIVSNVKSMVHPGGINPDDVRDKDAIGKKIMEVAIITEHVANQHKLAAKQLQHLQSALGDLFTVLEAEHKAKVEAAKKAAAAATGEGEAKVKAEGEVKAEAPAEHPKSVDNSEDHK